MKIFRIIFILTACLSFSAAFSQSDFKPGYRISAEGDTITGLIDYRGDIKNSIQCVFRINEKAESVVYNPGDIKAYRFTDSKYYISKTVPAGNDSLTLFIEFLVDGIANLYYYRDKVGEHYLIEKNDGKLVEMKNEDKEIEIDGKGKYLFNPKNYIGVLNAVFSDCKELRNPIMEAELNHKSLIGIVKDYHSYVCKDEKCIVYEKKIPFVRIEFAPTLGYNVTGIRFNGNKAYSLVDFTHSFNPSLGILMNTILPRVNERLSIQLEGEAGKYYFYGYRELTKAAETEYTDYHFNVVYLRSLASFRYTYPKGRVRPIACIGGGVQSILWNKSRIISEIERGSVVQTYVSQDIQINYVSLCIYGSVGMDFHITDKTTGFLVLQYDYIAGEGNYIIQNTGVRAGIYL